MESKAIQKNETTIAKRIMQYICGFLLLTLGQRLFVEAGFGAGSLDAVCVGLEIRTGHTAGTWVAVSAVIMVFIVSVLRKEKPDFKVLISSFVFGIIFDFWGIILGQVSINQNIVIQVLLYLAGIILAPLGTAIYFQSNYSKTAFDGLLVSVKDAGKMSIGMAKVVVEVLLCLFAYLVGGPLGVTTIITAVLFGPILQFYLSLKIFSNES